LKKNVDKTNFPPGKYKIIQPKAQSHKGISRHSGMGTLYVEGNIVNITEVIEVKDEKRIRGKLDTILPEWISLYGFDDGYTWVQNCKSDVDGHKMEWFYNLDETDKKSLIEYMSQAIQAYGGFNQNVELDMKLAFELESNQIQPLFALMYQKPSVYDQREVLKDFKQQFMHLNLTTEQIKNLFKFVFVKKIISTDGQNDSKFQDNVLQDSKEKQKVLEKIDSENFYREYHGHTKQHLMTVKNNFDYSGKKDGYIYLAGDSSMDNKHWFDTTADAVNGYEHFLEPPTSKCDLCYNINKLLAERDIDYACINTAIEETTLAERDELLEQDKFIRDNITENDYLIICIGGNDIALIPSDETKMNLGRLIEMSNPEEIRNNTECWGLEHFKFLFKTKMEVYLHKLCEKKTPKKILLCMIYYPDEEKEISSWANGALRMLKYNENPQIVQTAINIIFKEAMSKVEFHGEVIFFPLYSVLDGKTSTDYCSRVEPSPSGGAKLANAFLNELTK